MYSPSSPVKRRGCRHAIVHDPTPDLVRECGISQNRLVNSKNGCFFMADLGIYLFLQRALDSRRCLIPCSFVVCQLGCDFCILEALGVGIHENLVNDIGRPDCHARGYCNSSGA